MEHKCTFGQVMRGKQWWLSFGKCKHSRKERGEAEKLLERRNKISWNTKNLWFLCGGQQCMQIWQLWKKNLFSFILFTPTFFLVRERCQYSTCIQFPGSNVPNTYQCCALTRASKAKVTQLSKWTFTKFSFKNFKRFWAKEHLFYFPRGGRGGCFDFYCFLTHSCSSLVRPLSLATCKCKDKLTTHYTSHYAPQFATPPYPFPSGMFSLVRKQIHGDCMYFGFVISLRSQKYKTQNT